VLLLFGGKTPPDKLLKRFIGDEAFETIVAEVDDGRLK
jgi:hypothetical protein